MSGSWLSRTEAGEPLKPGDLAVALRDLAAAQRVQEAAIDDLGELVGVAARRLVATETKLAEVLARLEADAKPAKAQGGSKAAS